jgi:cyclic beta-1,2-glucan synthetase
LKKALNISGWDGRWYKRAYTDDGSPIGSIENEECRIDSISQSWGVISNAADNDKKYISMESLENHLIDTTNGIIKLLDPPFNKTKLEPGYIKAYLPGVRENGGQYTHASIWAIIAFSILGFGDKAVEYYRMINPIEHSRTKEEAKKYKVEPYVIPADIYGAGNLIGRGGWTWYTGSSSWFNKAGLENILGLKIEKNILRIEPCIPSNWKEYSIRYKHNTSIYNIKVKNADGKQTGVEKFMLNGQIIEEKKIVLEDNGSTNLIEVEM